MKDIYIYIILTFEYNIVLLYGSSIMYNHFFQAVIQSVYEDWEFLPMLKMDQMQFWNVTMIWKAKPCILLSGIKMDWSFTGNFGNPSQSEINVFKHKSACNIVP